MSEKIISILGLIKTRLEGSTEFSGVTILTEDSHDIVTEINKALDGLGLFILVGNPEFDNRETQSRVLPNGDLVVPVEVYENPTLNRSGESYKVCRDVAWNIMRRVTEWKPGNGYQFARPQRAVPIISEEHQIYRVTIEFQVGMAPLTT